MEIRIENGEKCFGEKIIFSDFSCQMDFHKHSLYRISGESGKGKTTLLRILASLEKLDRGELQFLFGEAARGEGSFKVSMLFQENRLLEKCSALENLQIALPMLSKKEILTEMTVFFEEEDFRKKVEKYSGGMKRRLSFLRAMLFPFDFLLLDEPFTGLDKENRKIMEEYLLSHQRKRPAIFASHENPLLWKDYGTIAL